MPAKRRNEAEDEPLLTAHAVKVGGDHHFTSATPVPQTLSEDGEDDGNKVKPIHRAMDCLACMFFVVIFIVIRETMYGPGHPVLGSRTSSSHSHPPVDTSGPQITNLFEQTKVASSDNATSVAPHIVLMLIDDQGYNDMGSDSTDMSHLTPHIMKVASEGLWLTKYYSESMCTPARAALLTGRYPIHTGMQHGFVAGNDPWGLPLKHSLLPQYLKQAGKYQTHIVGKWHLGHFAKSRTPLERGFDSFYGYFTGFESYFGHIAESFICKEEHVCYADLRDDEEPVESKEYNAYLFMKQARAVIRNHGSMSATERTEHPLFLYYCLGNVHMPNEVPDKVMSAQDARLAHITYHERRVFGAMTTVLDDAVGEVVEDLKAQDMYDETVMVIASDNGAMSLKGSSGSNWPLRGMKGQSWEGGMRVHALVRSPSLPNEMRGTSYDGLFHVTDWLPTLIGGAIKRPDLVASENMDGVNHWHAMHTGSKAWPRTTIVHNIDLINLDTNSTYVSGAIRVGNYKLLVNVEPFGVVPVPNSNNADDFPTQTTGSPKDFLFDVTEDPGEHVNLIDDMPGVYNRLGEAFRKAAKGAVTPAYCGVADDDSATSLFDETGFVGPWRDDDVDYVKECITPDSDEDKRHIVAMYCAYRLLPMEECGDVEASSAS